MFGVHYEADNSRLYVVCAKHVTESQLLDEFAAFGTAQVKLNNDASGFSKVRLFHFALHKFPSLFFFARAKLGE